MADFLFDNRTDDCVPIIPVPNHQFETWLGEIDESTRRWIAHSGFVAKPGPHLLVPGTDHQLVKVIAGIDQETDPWSLAQLPGALPEGACYIQANWEAEVLQRATVAWGLGAYRSGPRILDTPLSEILMHVQAAKTGAA